jgi:LPXTG-site transpeptidase (sortase) family protein
MAKAWASLCVMREMSSSSANSTYCFLRSATLQFYGNLAVLDHHRSGSGEGISLENSAGGRYLYRVTKRLVVGPDSVEVMNALEGESLITLQTCTLPDYERRLIVQGELVEKRA